MRRFATVFFLAFLVAVTWPGYVPANRMTPSVLGLPLSFAWPAMWVVAGFIVLVLLDRSETRREDEDAAASGPRHRDRRPPRPGRRGR